MFAGQCTGFYTQSLLSLQQMCFQSGINLSFSALFNESLIQRGRNVLVCGYLKSTASHFVFIDADIKFDAAHLLKMVLSDKEIICGLYPKKSINWANVRAAIAEGVPDEDLKYHTGDFVVNLVGRDMRQVVRVDQPAEIMHGGTGFMVIRRDVFARLIPHLEETDRWYRNNVRDLGGNVQDDKIYEFFAVSIDQETKTLLSEDYHFCKLARSQGIKVWAAPWAQLGHYGSFLFEGRLVETDAPADERAVIS
jgi:hypothetical protein